MNLPSSHEGIHFHKKHQTVVSFGFQFNSVKLKERNHQAYENLHIACFFEVLLIKFRIAAGVLLRVSFKYENHVNCPENHQVTGMK